MAPLPSRFLISILLPQNGERNSVIPQVRLPEGCRLIERLRLRELIADPETLPPPEEFGEHQGRWRDESKTQARVNYGRMSDSVVAKPINVYFKAAVVCGGIMTIRA